VLATSSTAAKPDLVKHFMLATMTFSIELPYQPCLVWFCHAASLFQTEDGYLPDSTS
jgi:hypothetical protein